MNKNTFITNLQQHIWEIEDILKIINKKNYQEIVNLEHEHSQKLTFFTAHYNREELSKKGVSSSGLTEYSRLIDKLNKFKSEVPNRSPVFGQEDKYTCKCCKQIRLGQYLSPVSKEKQPIVMGGGNDNKFCSSRCLTSWQQTQTSHNTCFHCQTPFSGQHWTTYDERKKITHKFCSQSCCNSFCNKYNQVVIAWNTLLMERKNLKVPHFPTWEDLELKQSNGELESYVEQVKKRISEVRHDSSSSESNEEKMEETVSPIVNSGDNSESEDNIDDDKNQESRIKNQESRIKNQESRIKNQESSSSCNTSVLTPFPQ